MGRKKKNESTNNGDDNQVYIDAIKELAKGSYNAEIGTLDELENDLMPTGYIPSGDDYLDFIVSNRRNGGFPLGKYINIYSQEGVGKSLLIAKLIANCQKMGGKAVYFDTERATYPPFMEVLGVDPKNLIYVSKVNTVEKILETIVSIITTYLKNKSDYPMVIAIDSMTMVTTEKGAKLEDFGQEDQGYGEGAWKQKLLNTGLKKIHSLIKQDKIMFVTTDQVRDNFDRAGKFDKKTSDTSGWAQKFYSDVRIELTRQMKIKVNDEHVGNKVKAYVAKNRIAPAYRDSSVFLYNTRGMDNYASWIENGKKNNVMKASGKTIDVKYNDDTPLLTEDGKKPDKKYVKKMLATDKEFREYTYERMAKAMIREYEAYSEAQFVDIEDYYEEEEDDKSSVMKISHNDQNDENEEIDNNEE